MASYGGKSLYRQSSLGRDNGDHGFEVDARALGGEGCDLLAIGRKHAKIRNLVA